MKKIYPNFLSFFSFYHLSNSALTTLKGSVLLTGFLVFGTLQAQLPGGPNDYQRVDVVTGLSNSTTFKFLPDGRMLILDRSGEIVVYRPDTQSKVSAGTLSVFSDLEDGLIGVAVDPDFDSNGHIYLHYSPSSYTGNRVSRFTMTGDLLNMGTEVVLLQWPTQRNNYYHAAGDMDFDSQGNLYIATGDNSNHSDYSRLDETDPDQSAENTSSNTNDLRGKILRITPNVGGGPVEHPNYTIPAGNLFLPGTQDTRAEIYVMGARNPYRIFVDKADTDWLFWGEVGPDANADDPVLGPVGMDEMNLVKQAGNYGWPYFSGNGVNDPDTQGPNDDSSLYTYQITYGTPPYYNDPASPQNISVHNTGLTSLPAAQPAWIDFYHSAYMAGPRYHYDPNKTDAQRLPQEFDGRFFYTNFVTSHVWAVAMDGAGNIVNNEQMTLQIYPFSANTDFIDMQIGPDDHLYVLEYWAGTGGKVVRLDYTGEVTNRSPIVQLSADPTNGPLPLMVNFSSAGTIDPDGDSPLTYEWDFETDGTIDSTAENPTHTYTVAGDYNAQLRVSDGNGGEGVANITINAGNTLAAFTFRSPLEGGFFDWNDDISLDVYVSDAEDGDTDGNPGTVGSGIDCNDVDILPELGHANHSHADLTISGCPQPSTLDPQGHNISGDADLFFVIGVDYTDQGGLTASQKIEIYPKRNEAEFRDGQSGTQTISNSDVWNGGSQAIRVDAGGYIYFENRNLLNINSVRYRVASASPGGAIEFRTGSPTGPLLASTVVPDTGGTNNWIDIESSITDPGGLNDLYFVFTGTGQDIFDLNYVEFIGPGVSIDNSPPVVNDVTATGPTTVAVEFSEYVQQSSAEQLANYSIDNGVSVTSATLQPDGRTVILGTSSLNVGQFYNVTINNVQNLAGLSVVTDTYQFSIEDPVRVNSGGAQVITGGQLYLADQYATGGNVSENSGLAIDGTTDDVLYQSERWGAFTYEIPVPASGDYDIRLHFAEIFFGQPGAGSGGGAGSRVFDVRIEGNMLLDDFDIMSEVPTATALVKEFNNISVTDGLVTIEFISVVNQPKVSAIEILPPDTFTDPPSIMIVAPITNSDVNQPFDVNFVVENWEVLQGSTHMHYFIDGMMIGPHYNYEPITIDGLPLGSHTIRLELFNVAHSGTGVYDEITVNVTDQLTCNESEFPLQWQEHEIDTELPYRSLYIIPDYDLDGDGLKDIVTGGWWYKNPGTASGTWNRFAIGGTFKNVAHVYDFDGDGYLDLFGTEGDYVGVDLVWAKNDGSGNFTVYTNIPPGTAVGGEEFIAGLAGGVYQSGGPYQMAITWNRGEGGNSEVQMVTVPADPVNGTWTVENIHPTSLGEGLSNGDIDGDGDLDLFQAGNWLRNDGGTWTLFSTGITYATTFDRNRLSDIDRDGDLDGVVGQIGANQELAWFEAPADPTQPWTKNEIDPSLDAILSLDVIDMDFDGDDDVIVGEWQSQFKLFAFENDLCDSGTWIKHELDAGGGLVDHHDGTQVTDIDNDGDLDIVSQGWRVVIPRIFENLSSAPTNTIPIADAGEDQTVILPTNSITLNGSGNDPDGGSIVSYLWTQQSGPSTATLTNENTADLTASDLVEGVYVFRLTVTDDETVTGFDEVNITVSANLQAVRINSGGDSFTFNADDWSADQYFVGGDTFTNAIAIANTANDELYQSERWSGSGPFSYEIPATSGTFDVVLHFAEIFFGVPGAGSGGGAGSRIFNVDIEGGQGTLTNYDIYATAGGPATAVIESFNGITVNDGFLTITLTGVVDNPKISGIEVFASASPIANAGSDQTITLPTNSITLNGSGNDPDGGSIVSYLWTQQSGPSAATLANETTANLTASDLAEGSYVFRLTVTDDETETGFDDVSVFVVGQSQDELWLEAECAGSASNWTLVSDASASEGEYLLPPVGNNTSSAPTDPNLILNFTFSVTAGTYTIYGRVLTPSNQDDSFWVRVNGGNWLQWNSIPGSGSFSWHQVHFLNGGIQFVTFDLADGVNTLEIARREDGTGIDKVFITKTGTVPSGLGGSDPSCGGAGKNTDPYEGALISDGSAADQDLIIEVVSVSPNPANSYVNLATNKEGIQIESIYLFDSAGRLIKKLNSDIERLSDSQYQFSTRFLEEGLYHLKITTSTHLVHHKPLVIMK